MAVNEHKTLPADIRFQKLQGSTIDSCTFSFGDEDHTLGNALRHVLMQQAKTELCGYSVPHPTEPYMHVRLQTIQGSDATEVLKDGLNDLAKICDTLTDKFDKALNDFESSA
uniref:DNA-directed RNA polymerase RBP11-like dimerisation domain-containing protein n=1 Tax=Fibrocapsa japonica TaxID=94617 RepID=A0A7S2UY40_9STRA|mmetsp:Transcript_1465/g.2028  ORF Transcript_1465/g.2028 Transcript_1465/m.2028 type:complete len:112 (+) Transcript_1465:41-376(+)|eukprot:CAMPEP_0113936152 /NCGR_PEP_ID=MMETSP1339-20121228/3123_1 /TAXON_ID=94617 /ORGANISM="Fibrocapsa japonica" /LENGTH=111 /DNA_ID=CAMNT_0000938513 /DNA_START=14 /DNA_END=349 /DNA_ORIENTATION=+ /assembly_acc=CAM_ASM_000762